MRTKPSRRAVKLVSEQPHVKSLCGPRRLWAYGYEALAALRGVTPAAVRRAVERGRLDPGSLRSVVEWLR